MKCMQSPARSSAAPAWRGFAPLRVLLALLCMGIVATAAAQSTTSITYQGELYNGGIPVNGAWEFRFILYDAEVGGAQAGDLDERSGVLVSQGIFTTEVDFGPFLTGGDDQFIEIAARAAGSPSFTVLSPRQRVTSAPRAASLRLPYADSVHSNDTALVIANTHPDGAAMDLITASSFATMLVRNEGGGSGLNLQAGNPGIMVSGSALRSTYIGADGSAGTFDNVHADNVRPALIARSQGIGTALSAEINANIAGSALVARTVSTNVDSFAGVFQGPVRIICPAASCRPTALQVVGNLTKTSGTFKIDHPLEPETKFLSHSFVESPDMKNIYDGVVTLDARGEASVTLPRWFEALNRDARYQLTAIGAAAPNLHIAAEVHEGRFRIAGGPSRAKVSWQVTGIRQDAYARMYPTPVEEDKSPSERGRYLVPAVFGKPESLRIDVGPASSDANTALD